MDKHTDTNRKHEDTVDREHEIRRSLDEQGDDAEKFDPRGGEDPGLLELTEDPRERRMKRHTM
jgi:hypothetical protein